MSAVSHAFYALSIAALAFFLHKVLWLVQFKRIQRGLVDRAVDDLRAGNAEVLRAWEQYARGCWAEALGAHDDADPASGSAASVQSPSSFIRRVEEWLARLRDDLETTKKSVETVFVDALAEGKTAIAETVLSVRRLSKGPPDRYDVRLALALPALGAPCGPDKKLFELDVKSRYGLLRRALVFFSGAADVVYSSQHVARMSQNLHVPTGVLVRRLSLVLLVLAVVLVDMVFGARSELTRILAGLLSGPGRAPPDFVERNVPAVLAFAIWMSGYGCIYVSLYVLVRRRYQASVRRLREMLAAEPSILRSIRARHMRELVAWGRAYGRSLDGALSITTTHAAALLDHCAHRVRRRIAGPALLDGARALAEALFAKLPESAVALADGPTTHPHSLSHYVWPRVDEMDYQIVLARYRTAWQHVELAVNALRGELPDPHAAHSLWRAVVTYATIFADILPPGTVDDLRAAYAAMVEACVEETDHDLAELDHRLGELCRGLEEQLACARSLVASKVELANQSIEAQGIAFSADVIQVREQARLEAMAFEI